MNPQLVGQEPCHLGPLLDALARVHGDVERLDEPIRTVGSSHDGAAWSKIPPSQTAGSSERRCGERSVPA
jgi:hypothetical protein